MVIFKNAFINNIEISQDAILICSIGYESRSSHILEKYFSEFNPKNVLCFIFDDYLNYPFSTAKYEEKLALGYTINKVKYEDHIDVIKKTQDYINKKTSTNPLIEVHVDYSSMPRSWYCRFLITIHENLRESDTAYFWYSCGKNVDNYENLISSGIENYTFYSGMPSLKANNNRSHVLGIGYDYIRSQAILSVIDPSYLTVCYSYPINKENISRHIKKVNAHLLSKAAISLSLQTNDFSFMFSKLCEISNELLIRGDVIFIPDGPKPLILAMSIVPKFLEKQGVSCLHISRHNTHYHDVDVLPTGEIYGFSFSKIDE